MLYFGILKYMGGFFVKDEKDKVKNDADRATVRFAAAVAVGIFSVYMLECIGLGGELMALGFQLSILMIMLIALYLSMENRKEDLEYRKQYLESMKEDRRRWEDILREMREDRRKTYCNGKRCHKKEGQRSGILRTARIVKDIIFMFRKNK